MRNKRAQSFMAGVTAVLLAAGTLMGCGSKSSEGDTSASLAESIPADATPEALGIKGSTEAAEADTEPAVTMPEDSYASELTGLPVKKDIQNQRPVAFMIDNDPRALPHYGIADADIVYEMMNSTENDRVSRLMCLFKDWENITQVGSIRSVRPTNIILNSEYNAVLCHDGGPFYIDEYLNKGYTDHFSGTFSRVDNGKAREFTEYCLTGDLDKNFSSSGVSKEYNSYKPDSADSHFQFAEYGADPVDLSGEDGAQECTTLSLPVFKGQPELQYNKDTETYDYVEYGSKAQDGGDSRQITFKNVIVQDCSFHQYDENGYMIYNVIQSGQPGYYITNGYAIPITWTKESENGLTKYYDKSGKEITVNDGSTYITLVPSDSWSNVSIK